MLQAAKQSGTSSSVLVKKLFGLWNGLWNAFDLNCRMLVAKIMGKKTLVFYCAATQFMHLEPVIRQLAASPDFKRIRVYFLTIPPESTALRAQIESIVPDPVVRSESAARFLLFCEFLLSVEQALLYPSLGCKVRACSFHGQPSKANVYQRFRYKQINTLFFYGPLMRDYYLENKKNNPQWPEIDCYEVGQPFSDRLFNSPLNQAKARRDLGLDGTHLTVVFAPSFEYCSSIATHGRDIIEALLDLEVNLIVKPHPGFYSIAPFEDEYNRDAPNVSGWRDSVRKYDSHPRCVFSEDNSLDSVKTLYAADVMLTDFSGIAFDGILLDMGMIYWECPLLYSDYLPKRFGIDGDRAKNDLACNVGRDAGIIVRTTDELAKAVAVYRENPRHKAPQRKQIREQLLFNPGCAAKAMAGKIEELIGIRER